MLHRKSIQIGFFLVLALKFVVSFDSNPCSTSLCQNFANCVPINTFNYTCVCTNSSIWTGTYCEKPTSLNPCSSSPCKKGSTCLFDVNFNVYTCICKPGYTGPACDQVINQCLSYPCKNRGTCSNKFDSNGNVVANFYTCQCASGYYGINCENYIDYCSSQPCLNGGICNSAPNSYNCTCLTPLYSGLRCENNLASTNATCKCYQGFYGPTCGLQINQCTNGTNPCNNGTCIPSASGLLPYTCQCFPGFTGTNCQTSLNLCSYNPPTCQYGGICTQTSLTTYNCACPVGTLGPNCQYRIPICASQPCKNNGTCLEPSLNQYFCLCQDNYIGSNCEIIVDTCEVNVCRNGGICSFGPNGYSCLCQDGFIGSRCEISLNPCQSNPCFNNGTCLRGINETYVCICPVPFKGQNCQVNYDLCANYNPCQNNGSCSTVGSSYRCTCPQWYSGIYCQNYTSICATNPCGANGQCFELATGSYQCFCNRYYSGTNCTVFTSACLSSPCLNGGNCTLDAQNNFVCVCAAGFTSRRCESEINRCDSNPCSNGGICNNYFNYYNCTCSPGFSGINCQISNNPCLNNPCANGAACLNQYGKALCVCPPNYSGNLCQFKIDFCLSRPCQNAGNCISNSTSYSCTCLAGFTGTNCQNVQDPCSNLCQNGGTCYQNANLIVGCDCPCQYTGTQCEIQNDFCVNNLCQNGQCYSDSGSCSYQCICDSGFIGEFCETPINACFNPLNATLSNCLNGATCTDLNYSYSCQCTPGFTGTNCETPSNTCIPNNCKNGASCTALSNDYVCTCPCPFYTGKNCDFYTDICSIEGSQCLNGGTCISNRCSFSCQCPQNYTGYKCEKLADPCSYNTCSNNGTCVSILTTNTFKCLCTSSYQGPTCNNLITPIANNPCSSNPCNIYQTCTPNGNNYSCSCPPMHTGALCETKIRACSNSPCQNNAICIDNLAYGNYSCICPAGLNGTNCELQINACNSNPCYNNAVCNMTNVNQFECTCPPGITGTLCEIKLDPCQSYPCFNGGACLNINGNWSCNCNSTCYTGSNCNQLVPACSNQNCSGNGVCLNTGPCLYKCICSPGTTGLNCQTLIPPCNSNPCSNNGTCVSNNNSYSCVCPAGFTGSRCTVRMISCSSSPCENGGICTENTNLFGYKCTCTPGWTGDSCQLQIDLCATKPCKNNGICIEDNSNSFKCFCPSGYTGNLCQNLIDPCLSQPCLNGASCNSTNSTFTCTCPLSFYGSLCQFTINNCATGPCSNGGICVNLPSGYQCNCPSQFSGPTCSQPSCENYCVNGGTCSTDAYGNLTCICSQGFQGPKCASINDPCLSNNPCTTGQGVCVNNYYGSYTCVCYFGFYGQFCESKTQVCNPNPCITGTCLSTTPGIAICRCPTGFTGRFCETNINVCSSSNPCLNGGVCQSPTTTLTCPPGLTGSSCSTIINTCTQNICENNVTCVQQSLNTFTCLCPPYLTGQYCENKIDLCAINNPCSASAKCIQISFLETKCVCPPGFTGTTCTQRFDVCQSNPCLNGDCVSPLPGIFRCNCKSGYKGNYCEISLAVCDYTTCLNGGYCVNNYTTACICPNTFTGTYCEKPIDPCKQPSSPSQTDVCNGNGDCYYVQPGEYYCNCNNCWSGTNCNIDPLGSNGICLNNLCSQNSTCVPKTQTCDYECSCQPGFTGIYCEKSTDPCINNQCFNNATCVANGIFDGYNCTCPSSYTGQFCETQLNQCQNYNCLNNGVCIINQQYNQPMCLCQYGFTGIYCDSAVNFCANNPCLNNSNCTSANGAYTCHCQNGFGGQRCEEVLNLCELYQPCEYGNCFRGQPNDYVCFCFAGYTGKNCSNPISYCNLNNPCKNGICIDYIGGYTCNCTNGYVGNDCSQLVNPCTLTTNPCGNGTCSINASYPNNYMCTCFPGYDGTTCQNQVNLCSNNGNCVNGTCVQVTPSFSYCNCSAGFTGSNCAVPVNLCDSVTCFNKGTCNNLGNGQFNCSCLPGFNGTYCEIQPNYCLPNPCLNNGVCVLQNGGYICKCATNYGGLNCQISQLCGSNNPCQNSAQCLKTLDGTVTCTCNPGFIGTYCDQVYNPCQSNPCVNGACSTYNLTNYQCSCTSGFQGSTCATDINECSNSNTCKNSGKCINTYGSFVCQCLSGFSGTDCSIIDPCATNKCNSTGTFACVPQGTNYTCQCNSNYIGTYCSQFNSPCLSQPCANNGTCNYNSNSNSYSCQCASGYTGNQCQTMISFCTLNSTVCGPYGTCVSSSLKSYNCTCYPGFTGSNCQTQINTCTSNPCLNGGSCTAAINYFTCQCTSSYTGSTCSVTVNPCSLLACNNGTCNLFNNQPYCKCNPGYAGSNCQFFVGCQGICENNGVCNADYTACICPAGYAGTYCQLSTNLCSSQPCLNGGQCANINTTTNNIVSYSFSCTCSTGFSGNTCQTKLNPCVPNPCLNNGACSSSNSSSFTCVCPQPYSGPTCNITLSICNFVNCGQGSCVAGAVYPNYNCNCNSGYSGPQCNINTQGCSASPCMNGGTCNNLGGLNYSCTCPPEYEGINCQTAKTCVPTYNYCSSMPCQNNGKCIQIGSTCTIYCNCNATISTGQYCQNLINPNVYTNQNILNLLAPSSSSSQQNLNFNLQVLPCITSAWQQSNQQFACPNGFVMIPSISNLCYLLKPISALGLTKQNVQSNCQLLGGSLVTIETSQKLASIIQWLPSVTTSNVNYYFWLNTALTTTLNNQQLWVWGTNGQPISFDWAPNQQTNFNGVDSVYLNSTDSQFYAGIGSQNYSSMSGIFCQAPVSGLSSNNLNVVLFNQTQAFSTTMQSIIQLNYSVSIALNNGINMNQVQAPNASVLSQSLNSCFQTSVLSTVYTVNQAYSISICGNSVTSSSLSLISTALLNAWLQARPEFLQCSVNNCVKIIILSNNLVNLDQWNQITQIYYVITVNGVLLNPTVETVYPTAAQLQQFIQNVPANINYNYLLCEAKLSSTSNVNFVNTLAVQYQSVPLVLDQYILEIINPNYNNFVTAIQNSLIILNPVFSQYSVNVTISSNPTSSLGIYSSNIGTSSNINANQVLYPLTSTTFQITLNGVVLSFATQSLFDLNKFYTTLSQVIATNAGLNSLNLNLISPNTYPIVQIGNLFHLTLTKRIASNNRTFLQNAIKTFINQNQIAFNWCKLCWNDTSSINVQLVYVDVLVDLAGTQYYDYWFVIIVQNPSTGLTFIAQLSNENDFITKFSANSASIYSFLSSQNFMVPSNQNSLRRFANSFQLQLQQSVLNEDISNLVNIVASSVQARSNVALGQFKLIYSGQNEYLSIDSLGQSNTYWQAIFFVLNPSNSLHSTNSNIYSPTYDYSVNLNIVNQFLSSINTIRGDLFYSSQTFNSLTDYRTKDLFYIPCYGAVNNQNYKPILSIYQQLWTNYLNNISYSSSSYNVFSQSFYFISTPSKIALYFDYIGLKGFYSAFPFSIKTNFETIYPDVYPGPSFSVLKSALSSYCNVSDPLSAISRTDQLNYITSAGLSTLDQADSYLLNINIAYANYLASLSPPAVLTGATQIMGLLTYFTAQVQAVSTRIYYQVYANTTEPMDAFNFQIQYTTFTITAPSNLAPLIRSRSLIETTQRSINLNKLNVALVKLPSISLEGSITYDQSTNLINSLVQFWQLMLTAKNIAYNNIIISIATSQDYVDLSSLQPVTKIFYVVAVDQKIYYTSDLPDIDNNALNILNQQLYPNGFKLAQNSNVQVRTVFLNIGTVVATFNVQLAATAIKNGWIFYLNTSNIIQQSFDINDVSVSMIDQNVYYNLDTPYIGIRYAVSLRNMDPSYYAIPDPTKTYFTPYFSPLTVYGGTPLLSRRMYVYGNLIKNPSLYNNSIYMKLTISSIWQSKNPISDPTADNPIYSTPYFSTLTGNLLSNIQNVPLLRSTYTESINGNEPLALLYETPVENDFNVAFLDSSKTPFLMGFCFSQCYNYRQSGLYILNKYSQNPTLILNAITKAWTDFNQISSKLLLQNQIQIAFISNSAFTLNQQTGYANVIFNVFIGNSNSRTQIDSLDLNEPTIDKYLSAMQIYFPAMAVNEVQIISPSAIISSSSVSTPSISKTTIQNYIPNNITSNINPNSREGGLLWWGGLLIAFGVLLFTAILLVIGCWFLKGKIIRERFFSSTSYLSSSSSSGSFNGGLTHKHKPIDQFSVLASTFPQGDAFTSVTNMTPRSSFDNRLITGNLDIGQQIFGQIPRPSNSKTPSLAQFYPGIPIESIVPNPVFVNKPVISVNDDNNKILNNERLITSIYVTNSNPIQQNESKN